MSSTVPDAAVGAERAVLWPGWLKKFNDAARRSTIMKLSAMPRAAQDEATLDVPPWTPRSQLSRLVTARTADDAEPSPSALAEPPPPSPRAKIHTPPWLRAGLEVRTPDDAASASSGSELPTPAESPLTPLLLKPTQPMMCADCGELYSPPSCTTCRCAALAKVSLGKPRQVRCRPTRCGPLWRPPLRLRRPLRRPPRRRHRRRRDRREGRFGRRRRRARRAARGRRCGTAASTRESMGRRRPTTTLRHRAGGQTSVKRSFMWATTTASTPSPTSTT